jgi:hypothetical protein
MDKFDYIERLLKSHWLTASILLLAILLMSIPPLREGIKIVLSWIKHLFIRKDLTESPIIMKLKEESVTFDELVRSYHYDVVKVNAYTHSIGVMAEHEWITSRYPENRFISQALTTLDRITNIKYGKSAKIYFDIFRIELPGNRKKTIYFDISSFFDGSLPINNAISAQTAKKILQIYSKNYNNIK